MQRQELEESLKVPLDDHSACAAAARLWESLLESHRTPFLLIRVADMQFALESRLTALSLYEEVRAIRLASADVNLTPSYTGPNLLE
jgi:hypothetical protein